MVIEDKYFDLLHTLIYDKRRKMSGMLSDLIITRYIDGYGLSYEAFMSPIYALCHVFVEDIEAGNVVFLLPWGVDYQEEMFEEMAKNHTKKIKAFFGDKFREDMIMRISEEDRQKELRKWNELSRSLDNWNNYFYNRDKEISKD